MLRLISVLAALALLSFISLATASFVGNAFTEDTDSADAGVLTTEIQQISSAIELYRAQEGESPTIKSGSESTKSGNDLLDKGYMDSWPSGWKVDAANNTIYYDVGSDADGDGVCRSLRKQLNEDTVAPPTCDGTASDYPCCTP